jgi:hypothetical protein
MDSYFKNKVITKPENKPLALSDTLSKHQRSAFIGQKINPTLKEQMAWVSEDQKKSCSKDLCA